MNTSMGMGGMGGGMNPMMMNPMMNPMAMGMGDGMNPMMGMPGMGMGMGGMGGMGPGMGPGGMGPGAGMGPAGMGGMGPGAGMGPAGGMGGPEGPMGGDIGPDSRFYKTKLCHKFQQGNCPYGPTCKYAHGQADMRVGGGNANRGTGAGRVMTPNGPAGGMGGPGMGGPAIMPPRAPAGGGGGAGAGAGGSAAAKKDFWRTRLCEAFEKNGTCPYGDNCTFAHGAEQLRGSGQGRQQGGAGGGNKRQLEQGGGGESNKRQKAGGVAPPPQEVYPTRDIDLSKVQQGFAKLQQEVNRFAADTGFSVAVFATGGVFTEQADGTVNAVTSIQAVRNKDGSAPGGEDLKVAVLKHGTGGVAAQLVNRSEIVKFIQQRGAKAMADLANARDPDQPSA